MTDHVLTCLECECVMRLPSAKPRVPLCRSCTAARARYRAERAARKAERRAGGGTR